MNTLRNGDVVSNSGGVYKFGNKPMGSSHGYEYEYKKTHNGAVLVAGLVLVGIIVWAIMNAEMIKAAIYGG